MSARVSWDDNSAKEKHEEGTHQLFMVFHGSPEDLMQMQVTVWDNIPVKVHVDKMELKVRHEGQ